MMGTAYNLAFSPLLPWWSIGALALTALLIVGLGLWRHARGLVWRVIAIVVLLATLSNPSLIEEKRDPQRDVAVVVVDESASQRIGDRAKYTEAALAHVNDRLAHLKDLDVRVLRTGKPEENASLADTGTQLFTALDRNLADVPRQRLAGIIMLTDGQVHDVPTPDRLSLNAPLHVLLSGQPNEIDRRLVIKQAPRFGLVGKTVELTVRIEDLGAPPPASGARARVTLRKDGGQPSQLILPIGSDQRIDVPIDHGGPNVVELEVESGTRELTLDNNRAALVINGVRDRLRVLLVSGEPHAGERTWRNILKSDPSVDLVHFTILRPPEKQDGTPIRELSLIAFPIRELFDVKLDEFDLIIFRQGHRAGLQAARHRDRRTSSSHRRAAGRYGRSLERAAMGPLVPQCRGGGQAWRHRDEWRRESAAAGTRSRR